MEKISKWNDLSADGSVFLADELYFFTSETAYDKVESDVESLKFNEQTITDFEVRDIINDLFNEFQDRIEEIIEDKDNNYGMNTNMQLYARTELIDYVNNAIDLKEHFENSLEEKEVLKMLKSVLEYDE